MSTRLNAAAALALLALAGCEAPKGMEWAQTGFRGTGQAQITNPRLVAASALIPPPPYELEDSGGDRARDIYENVQVLGHLSGDQFNHLMASMTEWVAPEGKVAGGGCNYCHNPENMASEEKYTYKVARQMLRMTYDINGNWKSHVQNTGVTCWTCHRGNPVPVNRWSLVRSDLPMGTTRLMGNKHGQNAPDPNVGFASLPVDPFAAYLRGKNEIRVQSDSAYPSPRHQLSIKDAEQSYALMMHQSYALGVNCTYCHNANNFGSWPQSRATRATAWYGIRMTRGINDAHITPLTPIFPANRKGELGDPYKVNCATCHQGLAKPLGGRSMLPQYPYLAAAPGFIRASAPGPDNVPADVSNAGGAEAALDFAVPAGVRALTADPRATVVSCNLAFNDALAGAEVQFDTDSAAVKAESRPLLDRVAQVAGRCSRFTMTIEGHTDVTASQATNLPLSRDRAASVARYLIERGVSPGQLRAIGYGESRPKVAGDDPAGNAENRRIEITAAG